MNLLLAIILSGNIIVWKTEPLPVGHVEMFNESDNHKTVMVISQKHEWTVERQKMNRKQRRRSK